MLSRMFAVACVLALTLAVASGDEFKGKVKKLDADKNTITITVDDKDQTFDVSKDTKIVGLYGKKLKKAIQENVPGGLSGVKEGVAVSLTTEKKDGKDVLIQVKLDELQAKKKKGT